MDSETGFGWDAAGSAPGHFNASPCTIIMDALDFSESWFVINVFLENKFQLQPKGSIWSRGMLYTKVLWVRPVFELPMWRPVLIVCVEHRTADDYLLIVAQQGKKNSLFPVLWGRGNCWQVKEGRSKWKTGASGAPSHRHTPLFPSLSLSHSPSISP